MRRFLLVALLVAAVGVGTYAFLADDRPAGGPPPETDPEAAAAPPDTVDVKPPQLRGDGPRATGWTGDRRTVRGTVLDLEGAPVADVLVTVTRAPQFRFGYGMAAFESVGTSAPEFLASAHSDPEGRFAFGGLPCGDGVKLRVRAVTKAPRMGSTVVVPVVPRYGIVPRARLGDCRDVDVTLQVAEGVPLALRVVRASGEGVVARIDARVLVSSAMRARWPATWVGEPTWTGVDGRLVLPAVPAGLLRVNVLVPDDISLRGLRLAAPSDGEHVIRLPGGGPCRLAGVVMSSSREGVFGARLVATFTPPKGSGASELSRSVETRMDGRYMLDGLEGTLTRIEVAAEGYAPRRFEDLDWSLEPGETLPFHVTLVTGGSIRGRVADPDGVGIAGATVSVRVRRKAAHETLTDADGRFLLEGVSPGEHVLVARRDGYYAEHEARRGFDSRRSRQLLGIPGGELVRLTEDGGTARQDFTLHRGVPVAGVVLDDEGTPVVSARIVVNSQAEVSDAPSAGGGWLHGAARGETTSGPDGRFSFAGLQPSPHVVTISARTPGLVSDAVKLSVKEGLEGDLQSLVLRVRPAAVLAGRVVDRDGKSVAGVLVWLPPSTNVGTDGAGHFRITGLRPGTYTLRVNGPVKSAPITRAVTWGEVVDDLVLVKGEGRTIQGVLVDEDGLPLPFAWLRFEADDERRSSMGQAYTDAEGSFASHDLPEGTYRVRTREGALPGTVEAGSTGVRLVRPEPVELPLHVVHGEVRAPDGGPLAHGRVIVTFGSDIGRPGGSTSRDAGVTNGRFRREIRTRATTIRLSVYDAVNRLGVPVIHEPVLLKDLSIDDSPFLIQLTSPGVVAGRVVDQDGVGVAGVAVTAHHGLPRGRSESSRPETTERTAADGSFRLTEVSQGEVTLSVRAPRAFYPVEALSVRCGTEDVVITLTRGASITGWVVGEDGEPLEEVPISAMPGTHPVGRWGHAKSEPDGSFTLEGLDPDRMYVVRTEYDSRGRYPDLMRCLVPDVSPGTADVRLVARMGVYFDAVVVLPDGTPATGGSVRAQPIDERTDIENRGHGWIKSPDGRVRVGPIAPGRYRVEASPPSPELRRSEPVEIGVPGALVRLILRGQPTRPGRVMGEDLVGFQVAAVVSGANVDHHFVTRTNVGADGSFVIPFPKPQTVTVIAYGRDDRYGIVHDVTLDDGVLEIELVKGLSIEGRVEPFETGRRRMGVVYAESLAYGFRKNARLDGKGAFLIQGLPPGDYDLTVFAGLGEEQEPTTVAAGSVGVVLRAPEASLR